MPQPPQHESGEQGFTPADRYSEGGAIMFPFSATSEARVPVVAANNAKEPDVSFIPSVLGISLMVVGIVLLFRRAMS
jgi:hypothetical protein